MRLSYLFVLGLLLGAPARAIEIRISAQALERTLNKQLFNTPDTRYYIRGSADTPCAVSVQDPKITFKDERIVIHVKTHARLGTSVRGTCLGVGLSPEADVSVVPDAQGESIGFRDARVENLTESRELNFLLIPFLSRKLPQQMKLNAAELVRQLLTASTATTGYELRLDNLKIHSMQVLGNALVVDFDGNLSVR